MGARYRALSVSIKATTYPVLEVHLVLARYESRKLKQTEMASNVGSSSMRPVGRGLDVERPKVVARTFPSQPDDRCELQQIAPAKLDARAADDEHFSDVLNELCMCYLCPVSPDNDGRETPTVLMS